MEKVLLPLYPKAVGTNKFGRHTDTHLVNEKAYALSTVDLSTHCHVKIADAAAVAVVLNLRPLSFTEVTGMEKYAEAVFLARQIVPAGVPISSKSFIPTGKTSNCIFKFYSAKSTE